MGRMTEAIYKGKFAAVTKIVVSKRANDVLNIHVKMRPMGDRRITRFADVEDAISEHWEKASEFRLVFPKDTTPQDTVLLSAKCAISQFLKARGKQIHHGIRANIVYFNKGPRKGSAHGPLTDGLTIHAKRNLKAVK